jgi:hypothetical protein
MQYRPAAASVAVAPLVDGPARELRAAVVTARAAYFTTGDPARPVLCLAAPDAVRLPCAVVLDGPLPAVGSTGSVAGSVGAGELRVGALTARIGRWWRPPRPRGLGRIPARAVAAALTTAVPDPLDRPGRAALAGLVAALASSSNVDGSVARLLGRGPGLTPLGDDVLAGALVTLVGAGVPVADRLAAVVRAAAAARTTAVSQALLSHATYGECIPELAGLLVAARDGGPLEPAVDSLLRIGHSSGAGLVHGVAAALAVLS